MKMGARAENVKRAFSGAIWEPSAGYCRAVRSGNIIAGKQRLSLESTPDPLSMSLVQYPCSLLIFYVEASKELGSLLQRPSQYIQSLFCSLHEAMLGKQQSLLTDDSSEVV